MLDFNTIEIIPESNLIYNLLVIFGVFICILLIMFLNLKYNNIKPIIIMIIFGLGLIVIWNQANNSRIVYVKIEINNKVENIDKLVDHENIFEQEGHYYFVTSMKNGTLIKLKQTKTLEDTLNGKLSETLKTIEKEKRISKKLILFFIK